MSDSINSIETQHQDIKIRAISLPDEARGFQVVDTQSLENAAEFLKTVKALRKEIEDKLGPNRQKAYEVWKALCTFEKECDSPLAQAEEIIKERIAAYMQAQEAKQRIEAERAREAARKRSEDAKLADAVCAEQAGQVETAEAILNGPDYAPLIPMTASTPKIDGLSLRKIWRFRIVNPESVPDVYKVIDEKKIRKVVQALGEQAHIPGVEVYCEHGVAAKSA